MASVTGSKLRCMHEGCLGYIEFEVGIHTFISLIFWSINSPQKNCFNLYHVLSYKKNRKLRRKNMFLMFCRMKNLSPT